MLLTFLIGRDDEKNILCLMFLLIITSHGINSICAM